MGRLVARPTMPEATRVLEVIKRSGGPLPKEWLCNGVSKLRELPAL
jgi:hypothetical protein